MLPANPLSTLLTSLWLWLHDQREPGTNSCKPNQWKVTDRMGQASEWRLEFTINYFSNKHQITHSHSKWHTVQIQCQSYEPNHFTNDIVIFCGLVYILFGVKDHITNLACAQKQVTNAKGIASFTTTTTTTQELYLCTASSGFGQLWGSISFYTHPHISGGTQRQLWICLSTTCNVHRLFVSGTEHRVLYHCYISCEMIISLINQESRD